MSKAASAGGLGSYRSVVLALLRSESDERFARHKTCIGWLMSDILLVVSGALAAGFLAGFLAGYGVRELVSRRRRKIYRRGF
jgi:NhaP-type Na+/H+ or K+/H+ antiporter